MRATLVFIYLLAKEFQVLAVDLELIDCGIDHEAEVTEGDVDIEQYPWLGVLYYSFYSGDSDARAVTTVALIQAEFVIAAAADIGPMRKSNFRQNSAVLLGARWGAGGRRVRNYVLHPEYGVTYNTLALVQLRTPVRNVNIKPLCPPPERLRNPEFYVVKFKENEDYNTLQKQVIPVSHVMPNMCREFYLRANLYAKKMRPPHVTCAVSLRHDGVCVWDAGAALVARDVWGRWQLLGMSVRGPGCGAPSRYLDMMSYYPWVEASLKQFRRITISKISKQKYIMRLGHAWQRFGDCDEGERVNLIYREAIALSTDNTQYQFVVYNMSIYDNVEFTCLTLELTNASATSEMRVHHACERNAYGVPCYSYKGSKFEISVWMMFSEPCSFQMFAWGWPRNMTLLDIQEWKWEEGTHYPDFEASAVEYRGPVHETLFGYEPLDEALWVPKYELWTVTPPPDHDATTTRKLRDAYDVPKREPEESPGVTLTPPPSWC